MTNKKLTRAQPRPTTIEVDLAKSEHGISLRDYFAAKAMQAFCAGFSSLDEDWPRSDVLGEYEIAAAHAYRMADAMLKAREK